MYLLFLYVGFLIVSKFDILLLSLAFFVPCVFCISWAKIKGETWDIPNRENRLIPLIFTLVYLSILTIFWKSQFIIIFLVNVSIILIITKFWKIIVSFKTSWDNQGINERLPKGKRSNLP
ncbi:hypothetical protein JH146_0835 [Methanocaldococcus bathoardescens]|uniref:Uncharacterized protein n=2 Tax=Methanocaldococcus bathoardescens TaxID=1301915 RepID=A0A076LC00_9EURY|nr:hypothetical protein JH146_0835 [Methanocaldococcus bathoardescens]